MPTIAWAESAVPIQDPARRLDTLKRLGLAIEVEDRGSVDLERYRRAAIEVATVQAYRLHDYHPLHRYRSARQAAPAVLRDAIENADALDCRRVLAVCGFGSDLADAPFERALDFFDRAGAVARHHGVRILIEPLSSSRAAAFADPREVLDLLATLDDDEVYGLALDTGHLLDDDRDPGEVLADDDVAPIELQLKGRSSAPPDEELDLESWWQAAGPSVEVVAIEHREPIEEPKFRALVDRVREVVAGDGGRSE